MTNKIVRIGLLLFLLLAAHLSGVLKTVEDGGRLVLGKLSAPLFQWGSSLTMASKDRDLLKQENQELKKKLSHLIVDYARLEYLQKENELLKKELGFVQTNNYDFVAATVIAGVNMPSGNNAYFIDKGKKDGIEVGMPIVFADGILVGKVTKTNNYTSEWLPINDNNSLVSAMIMGSGKKPASGLVKGEHNLSLIMEYINSDQLIKEGDIVVTSGRERFIPAGLVIGQVVKVERKENEFFQVAQISSPIDLAGITKVVVIVGINQNNETQN